MKKVDVGKVGSRFDDDIADLEQMLTSAWKIDPAPRKLLVEASLMFAAVRWERFVHELFVAHINRDSKPFGKWVQVAIAQSVKEKRGKVVASHLRVELPKNLSRDSVHDVLDRDGENLTFKTTADLVTRATEWLPAAQAAKFKALTASDLACIDALVAVRNFLAHRSSSSSKTMNDALKAPGLDPYLKRKAHRIEAVGTHFESADGKDTRSRVVVALKSMRTIAKKL